MNSHLLSQEIRRNFLNYFKKRDHLILPSSSLIPHDDPTLLFINAGMNQFKDVFLGKNQRDYSRAVTSQKCIRVGGKHNDLENVGHTSRHLTFFEMLGNFSFGDYFKEQSIAYAWEVSTEIFKLEADKIWVTIFRDDDEAFEIWKKIVPEKRIVRLGEKDNFWSMGDTGPCGPCSELLFDRGPQYGSAQSPAEDATGERFLEFWNLVFMQFNRSANEQMSPLPKQSIDTGSGLERVVSLKMNVNSVFATDILRCLIAQIERVSRKNYNPLDPHLAPAFHVIADHVRSLSFAIADGAQPSNVERGYVLRKILRRAVRYGRMLGMHEPFLAKILPTLIETMGEDYRELKDSQSRIAEILSSEEDAFLRTLKRGGNILNSTIESARNRANLEISGEEAFKLKDTYGLPLEEILLIAKDTQLNVDLSGYQALEKKAKEVSKAAQHIETQEVKENLYKDFLSKNPPSKFVSYTQTQGKATIVAIVANGEFIKTLEEGQEGHLLLDQTFFYSEKGGQVGDKGVISLSNNEFTVVDCKSPYPGIILHTGACKTGAFTAGQVVDMAVDLKRRSLIQNNHTATHLLHFALQKILGSHIRQGGSLVEPNRFRFDFTHHKSVSKEEIEEIENLVNEKIRENNAVNTYEISYTEAQKTSDIKQFFGEKYDSTVRVVDIEFSKELCGGTHTTQTGTIGYFRISKESSIAAGTRRIEGVTGVSAEEFTREKEKELEAKIVDALEGSKKLQQQIKVSRRSILQATANSLSSSALLINGIPLITSIVDVENVELALFSDLLVSKLPSSVVMLATTGEGKCHVFIKISPDLVQKGIQASFIIKEIAPLIGGHGGGKPESAQAGGKNPENIERAFEKVKEIVLRLSPSFG